MQEGKSELETAWPVHLWHSECSVFMPGGVCTAHETLSGRFRVSVKSLDHVSGDYCFEAQTADSMDHGLQTFGRSNRE
jgi:hypothetical protein